MMDGEGLSAYERAREAQIARNKQEIKRIGLAASRRRARASAFGAATAGAPAATAAKRERKATRAQATATRATLSQVSNSTAGTKSPAQSETRAKAKAAGPLRRSKRQRGAGTVDYSRERVDTSAVPDTRREVREQYKRAKKKQAVDVLAESAAWLARHRASLAEQYNITDVPVSSTSPENNPDLRRTRHYSRAEASRPTWRAIARDKWGDGVLISEQGKQGHVEVDWEMFVLSRSSTPPLEAPDGRGLLQEQYAHCPWRLLVACVLMSRVSSVPVKTKAIEGFFGQFPTPTAVLASKPNEVFDIIKPLGLFPGRHRSVVEISTRFLTMVDQPFTVGLQPELKIYGVGAFGVDSYKIFCKSQTLPLPMDNTLAGYCRWVNSQTIGISK
jgi:methyl-CpG-binding domain protein 4